MLSALLAISLSTFAPPANAAARSPAAAEAGEAMPARVAEIARALGPEKMAQLIEGADTFVDDLARTLAVLDRRKASFRPRRLPKTTRARLVAYRGMHEQLIGDEGRRGEDLFVLAQWRLGSKLGELERDLATAKRGLEAIKSMLARLKALGVDPGAHYPVRIAYARVTDDGTLETVREQVPSADELAPAMARIDAALGPLVEYMREHVNELNAKRRAKDALEASFDDMLAGLDAAPKP